MIERDVKAKVKALVRAITPHAHIFMPVQTGFGSPDLDFIITVRGFALRIETKVDGKRPSARQETTIASLVDAGAIVCIINQHNLEDVATLCNLLDSRNYLAAFTLAGCNRAAYAARIKNA